MFSFQKIAVLIGVISFVWGAFRFIGQMQHQAQKQRDKDERVARKKKSPGKADVKSVDLEACPRCGAFVPGGRHEC